MMEVQRTALNLSLKVLRKLRLSSPVQHFLTGAGYLRFVQNTQETGSRQNPDDHVKHFLSGAEKLRVDLEDMEEVRRNPFYHYILARTKFYDDIWLDAISGGIEQLVVFGVGTDSRSFRFRGELESGGVNVIETDLQPWISQRAGLSKSLAKGLAQPAGLRQLELDLEQVDFSAWRGESNFDRTLKTLFVAEGVTGYVSPCAVNSLLMFIAENGSAGSRFAYDFKFSRPSGTTDPEIETEKFRMPRDLDQIASFHNKFGLKVDEALLGRDVQQKYLEYECDAPEFDQDGILIASV